MAATACWLAWAAACVAQLPLLRRHQLTVWIYMRLGHVIHAIRPGGELRYKYAIADPNCHKPGTRATLFPERFKDTLMNHPKYEFNVIRSLNGSFQFKPEGSCRAVAARILQHTLANNRTARVFCEIVAADTIRAGSTVKATVFHYFAIQKKEAGTN